MQIQEPSASCSLVPRLSQTTRFIVPDKIRAVFLNTLRPAVLKLHFSYIFLFLPSLKHKMIDRKKCHVNLRTFWKPEPSQCCSNKIAGRTKGWL